jgi:hypothetical protein
VDARLLSGSLRSATAGDLELRRDERLLAGAPGEFSGLYSRARARILSSIEPHPRMRG